MWVSGAQLSCGSGSDILFEPIEWVSSPVMREQLTRPDKRHFDASSPSPASSQTLAPGHAQGANPSRAEVAEFIARSRKAIASGKTDIAYKESDQAVKLAPKSSRAWNTKGRAELSRQNYIGAITAFSKAVELNKGNAWAWNNLGYTELMLGRYQDAAGHLAEATKHKAATGYMFNNLGLALEQLNRLDEARRAFDKGAKLGSAKADASRQRLEGVKAIRPVARQGSDESPPPVAPTAPAPLTKSLSSAPDAVTPPLHEQQTGAPTTPAEAIEKTAPPGEDQLTEEERALAYQRYLEQVRRKKSVLELAHEKQADWLKETQNSSNIISIMLRGIRNMLGIPAPESAAVGAPGHGMGGHTHGPDDGHGHTHGPDDGHDHSHGPGEDHDHMHGPDDGHDGHDHTHDDEQTVDDFFRDDHSERMP